MKQIDIAASISHVLSASPRSTSDNGVVLAIGNPSYMRNAATIGLSPAQIADLHEWFGAWLAEGWEGARPTEGPATAEVIAHFKDIAIRYRIEADHARTDAARRIDAALALIPIEARDTDLQVIAREQAQMWRRLQTERDELEELRGAWLTAFAHLKERCVGTEPIPLAGLAKWIDKTIAAQNRIVSAFAGRSPKGEAPESPMYDVEQLALFDLEAVAA